LVLGPLEIKNSSNARPFSFYEGYSDDWGDFSGTSNEILGVEKISGF
jgi:hypothetical protein